MCTRQISIPILFIAVAACSGSVPGSGNSGFTKSGSAGLTVGGGLVISSPLALDKTAVAVGETLHGTVPGIPGGIPARTRLLLAAAVCVAPVATITSSPPAATALTSATFVFTTSSPAPGSTFACQLDALAAAACTSPTNYSGLAVGGHTFAVTTTDVVGNVSATATYAWTITAPPPPVAVLPTFVQLAYATPQSPTPTIALPFPNAQTAGNLNVVVVGWNDMTSSVTSVTDTSGNVYQLAVGPTAGFGLTQSIYYAKNIVTAAAGVNVVKVVFNANAQWVDVRILEYAGIDRTLPVDAVSSGSGNGATSSTPDIFTTASGDLVVAANTVAGNTIAPGPSYVTRVITVPDGDLVEDSVGGAPSNYVVSASVNASVSAGTWVMQAVAFRKLVLGAAVYVVSPVMATACVPAPLSASVVRDPADAGVVWSADPLCGAVSDGGVFKSLPGGGPCPVMAAARADPTQAAVITVNIAQSPILGVAVTPPAVTLDGGSVQKFGASVTTYCGTFPAL
jgi:hypothetical protein